MLRASDSAAEEESSWLKHRVKDLEEQARSWKSKEKCDKTIFSNLERGRGVMIKQ